LKKWLLNFAIIWVLFVYMYPIIRSSSELRQNYNTVADICRSQKAPVFLTKNGEGDTVLMDIATYNQREEDLALAQRLVAAEMARLPGAHYYTLEEFQQNMLEAIAQGAKQKNEEIPGSNISDS